MDFFIVSKTKSPMSDFQPTGIFLRETTFRFLLIIEKSWQEWMDGQVKFLEGWRKTQANPPSMVTGFNTSLQVMANRWKHKQIQQWANEIRQKSPSVDEDCRTLCKEYVRQSCEEGKVNDRQLQVYLPRFETLLGVLCVYLAENPVFRDGQCVRGNHDYVRKNMRSAIADSIRHSLRETVTWQFTAEEIREKPIVHQVELTPVLLPSKPFPSEPQRDHDTPLLVGKWDRFDDDGGGQRSSVDKRINRQEHSPDRDLIAGSSHSSSFGSVTQSHPSPRTPQRVMNPQPPPLFKANEKPRSAFPRPGTPVPRSVALPLHRETTIGHLSSSHQTLESRKERPPEIQVQNQIVERNHYEPIEDGFKVPSTPAKPHPSSSRPVSDQPSSKTPPMRESSTPVRQASGTSVLPRRAVVPPTVVSPTPHLPHRIQSMTPEIQQKAQRLSFPLSVPPPISSPIPPLSSSGCAVLPFPSSPCSPSTSEEKKKEFVESNQNQNGVSSASTTGTSNSVQSDPLMERTVSISVPLCPQ
jgi:hypothetical protein